ncbi:hypothetical protein HK100_004498 [Physocladia obscura]|uniref:Ion transport domain-containing protein n=1 Tax=Physocladia obscura TaxID=109957 RepID=A0AAD5XGQ1_9FUNG|nr:hypothetical protein HK100_004498 [Physocladia obscura]
MEHSVILTAAELQQKLSFLEDQLMIMKPMMQRLFEFVQLHAKQSPHDSATESSFKKVFQQRTFNGIDSSKPRSGTMEKQSSFNETGTPRSKRASLMATKSLTQSNDFPVIFDEDSTQLRQNISRRGSKVSRPSSTRNSLLFDPVPILEISAHLENASPKSSADVKDFSGLMPLMLKKSETLPVKFSMRSAIEAKSCGGSEMDQKGSGGSIDRQLKLTRSASFFISIKDAEGKTSSGEDFQKMKLGRRRSTVSNILQVTTAPKFTSKGSIVSEKDFEERKTSTMTRQSLENMLLNKFWKRGLNARSGFNSVIYIGALWAIPLKIGFNLDFHWLFSVILTSTFFFDNIIEMITLKSSYKAMIKLKDPTLQDWQIYYLRHTFIIDIVSMLPLEQLPITTANYLWITRLIRLYKLPHILNTSPYFLAARKYMENLLGIGQTVSGIFPLSFALCVFLHVQACALFFVGDLTNFSNSAIAQVQFKSTADQYTWALFTVEHILAVGNTFPLTYKPLSSLEQLVVLVFIIAGAGLVSEIMSKKQHLIRLKSRLYKQKMDELREYMRWKDLNYATKRKVMKYYEIKYRGKFFEEGALLNEMNESLRMEIAAHNCRSLIEKVDFLKRNVGDGRDELFLGRVAIALTALYFVSGDVIISQGDIGHEMSLH